MKHLKDCNCPTRPQWVLDLIFKRIWKKNSFGLKGPGQRAAKINSVLHKYNANQDHFRNSRRVVQNLLERSSGEMIGVIANNNADKIKENLGGLLLTTMAMADAFEIDLTGAVEKSWQAYNRRQE